MLTVSREFQEAIRQPQRKMRIGLTLIVWSPEYAVYEFGDEAVIADSLTITDQFSGGKFGFGSIYSRNVSVQIDADKVPGLDPININLTGAILYVNFYLTLPSGTEEAVYLGCFFADGDMTKRKKKVLTINAADRLTQLNVPVSEQSYKSVYDIAHDVLWNDASINLKNSKSEIEVLPNGKETLVLGAGQIQTVSDALMWLGDLTGTFIRDNLDGSGAYVEFVQMPTKYTKGGTAGNFDLETFKADNGTIIPANVRFNTDYTDTSIRPTTYVMRRNGITFVSVNDTWTSAPDTLFGSYEFDNNPLLAVHTDEQMQTIMDNIRSYADDLRFCPFTVKFNGNPAIQCGDFVYLEPGGGVDDTQFRHYGIVTYYKWKYRGASEIRCATDMAGERPANTSAQVQSIAENGTAPQYPIKAKSQIEKRLDGISNICTELIGDFGGKYVFRWNGPDKLCAYNNKNEEILSITLPTYSDQFIVRGRDIDIEIVGDHLEIYKNGKQLIYLQDNGYVKISDDFVSNPAIGIFQFKGFQVNTQVGTIYLNGQEVFRTQS